MWTKLWSMLNTGGIKIKINSMIQRIVDSYKGSEHNLVTKLVEWYVGKVDGLIQAHRPYNSPTVIDLDAHITRAEVYAVAQDVKWSTVTGEDQVTNE